MNEKKWAFRFVISEVVLIILAEIVAFLGDPYIHYRIPSVRLQYSYNRDSQRFVNDGFTKRFKYDSIITGTSMTECFLTSELDDLFGTDTIKVPYAGAFYDEITENLYASYESGHDLKMIVRSLDYYAMEKPVHNDRSDLEIYPQYLYDKDILNDIRYLLSKRVLVTSLKGIINGLINGGGITSFDDYCNWSNDREYGRKVVLDGRKSFGQPLETKHLSNESKSAIHDNLEYNIIRIAKEHPETTFYYFLPPFSIVKWGEVYEKGEIEYVVSAEKYAIELLNQCENIKVFAFDDCYWITTDLDNYREKEHFGGWINSYILQAMKNGEHQITITNMAEYFDNIMAYYSKYDYETIFY